MDIVVYTNKETGLIENVQAAPFCDDMEDRVDKFNADEARKCTVEVVCLDINPLIGWLWENRQASINDVQNELHQIISDLHNATDGMAWIEEKFKERDRL